jgi:hypothetical protein
VASCVTPWYQSGHLVARARRRCFPSLEPAGATICSIQVLRFAASLTLFPAREQSSMQTAWLLFVYVLIVVIGEAIVVAIGLAFWDRKFPALSVPISIVTYLAVFFLGWKLAVRVTEPKHGKQLSS